jgi:hypothetical protein
VTDAEWKKMDEEDAKREAQATLPEIKREKPPTVVGDRVLAEFVKPHFSIDTGTRFCALEFSFALTKDHKGKLPKVVEEAWKYVEKRTSKGVVDIEIADQVIDVYLTSDDKDIEITLRPAAVQHASVSLVKEIGKGSGEKVVRFSFRAFVEATKNVYVFSCTHFGDPVWLEMEPSQGVLEGAQP